MHWQSQTNKEDFIQGYYNRGEKPERSLTPTLLKQGLKRFYELGGGREGGR